MEFNEFKTRELKELGEELSSFDKKINTLNNVIQHRINSLSSLFQELDDLKAAKEAVLDEIYKFEQMSEDDVMGEYYLDRLRENV